MKKGRHRRYEEARSLKHMNDGFDNFFSENEVPCIECDALPGQDHKSWCLTASAKRAVVSASDGDDDLFPA